LKNTRRWTEYAYPTSKKGEREIEEKREQQSTCTKLSRWKVQDYSRIQGGVKQKRVGSCDAEIASSSAGLFFLFDMNNALVGYWVPAV